MTDCFCCTCKVSEDGFITEKDIACRNHGAHGLRECAKHKMSAVPCTDGCGMTIDKLIEVEH